jgi:hypothetical protein
MNTELKLKVIIYAAGVLTGIVLTSLPMSQTKRDIKKKAEWNDSITSLNNELQSSKMELFIIRNSVDSIMRKSIKDGLIIDSLKMSIKKHRKQGDDEIKNVRYWNDAKRDSFWRAEGARW